MRARFMRWMWLHQDRLPDGLLDSRAWDWLTTAATWLGCKLAGHEPAMDHCGLPEHDACAWCQRLMPGQAPRRSAAA